MIDFRIYYGDGSTFDGRPEDAPTENVQAIAWDDPTTGNQAMGRVVLESYDIYLYSDHVGGWHATNKYYDLMQHLMLGCGPGGVRAVLTGRWVSKKSFKDALYRAKTDPVFRPKSARQVVLEDGTE